MRYIERMADNRLRDQLRRELARGETEYRAQLYRWRNHAEIPPQGFPYGDTYAHHGLAVIEADRRLLDSTSVLELEQLAAKYQITDQREWHDA